MGSGISQRGNILEKTSYYFVISVKMFNFAHENKVGDDTISI
jgi:hypothetical protein